jgi:asparagine synthase (glutamine-hydrolysing)
MCGIAGLLKYQSKPTAADVAAVIHMLDVQVQRGPDDWGLLLPESALADREVRNSLQTFAPDHISTYADLGVGPWAVLGARRLSIIDLSSQARMPMGSPDGLTWITYNGEIYNFRELRTELQACGHRFRSNSDTEVLLYSYQQWGEKILDRIRGIYAFAIFSARPTPSLFFAKDRFGVKPLYYHESSERLLFASQVRAIRESGLIDAELSPEVLLSYLQLGSVPVPQTTLQGVLALRAGECRTVAGGKTTSRIYWNIGDHLGREHRDGKSGATLRELLTSAAQEQLVSDVPLGIFLSGGTDSSALVALAAPAVTEPLRTVAVTFKEPQYDESRYARLIASKYQTQHTEVCVTGSDFYEELPRIAAAMDQPTVDGVNTYFVSKAARQAGLTVVFSGLGGDEVFLGYKHFRLAHRWHAFRRMFAAAPRALRSATVNALIASNLMPRGGEKFAYFEDPSPWNSYLAFRGVFAPQRIGELLAPTDWDLHSVATATVPDLHSRNLLDAFVAYDFTHYLQDQLLRDTDFMSMAHSIEARVPFLDHRIVEHVLSMPAAAKISGRVNKPLLVRALGDRLPREIWDRSKAGFTFPFDEWMRQDNGELERATLEQTYLNPIAVRRVWTEFRAGRLHWSRPWALYVLRQFIGQRAVPKRPPVPAPIEIATGRREPIATAARVSTGSLAALRDASRTLTRYRTLRHIVLAVGMCAVLSAAGYEIDLWLASRGVDLAHTITNNVLAGLIAAFLTYAVLQWRSRPRVSQPKLTLLLTDCFDATGGIQTFNRALLKASADLALEHDWQIELLVRNDTGKTSPPQQYFDGDHVRYHGFSRSTFRFVTAAIRRVMDSSVIVVGHVNFTPPLPLLRACARRAHRILVVHGIEAWERLPMLKLWGVRNVNEVLSVSEYTRDQMRQSNALAGLPFRIFPDTLDPFYSSARTPDPRLALDLPQGPMILTVSRLHEAEFYKRIDLLLHVMPGILAQVPNAFLVVVGEGGVRPELERLAKKLGLESRVFFTGRVPDSRLSLYYQACDVFVLPSLKEGFGIVFLEAMQFAKPCVGARAGAVPEVVLHGRTGLLTRPSDPDSLRDALVTLLRDPQIARSMGEAGRQRLEREFAFPLFRQRLADVLVPLMDKESAESSPAPKAMTKGAV